MLVLLLMSLKMALHICPRLVDSVEELGGAVHVAMFFTDLLDYFLLPLSWIFFFLTAFSDPGIIPRSKPEDHPEEAIAEIRPQQLDPRTGMPRPRYLLLNGVAVKQKWCRTCRIYRPPRSHHCSVCDDCVTRFDHHCAVLGTCVGLGNYRYFLCLIVTLGLSSLLALALCIAHIVTAAECSGQKVGYFVLDHLDDFLVAIFCVLLVFGFAMLNMYHLYITAHNLSTNEHLKRYYRMNPFDHGTKENYSNICCTPDMLLPAAAGGMNILASYHQIGTPNSDCLSELYD
ncbi:Zinc finger, DHHC-type containing [Perkinsus olseni]|uniref:Palmitoyltransferase n=2 Tax=Perkinsus olseni TaxID=32597 RepID=A0A7J6NY54_PEROL|nr:Zinc finger, DHHC-type containing [Perkinsus olseni]